MSTQAHALVTWPEFLRLPERPEGGQRYEYVPQAEWDALPPNDYPVYAPPLVIDVLSPSNTPAKTERQRMVAMSAGTQAFWVVTPETRTVQVTDMQGAAAYGMGDSIPSGVLPGSLSIADIFNI